MSKKYLVPKNKYKFQQTVPIIHSNSNKHIKFTYLSGNIVKVEPLAVRQIDPALGNNVQRTQLPTHVRKLPTLVVL